MKKLFGAKAYFSSRATRNDDGEIGYEMRIVLLKATDTGDAIKVAESEALAYAKESSSNYLGFVEVYKMSDYNIKFDDVVEVYSLTFFDDPDEDQFLDNYYLTGGNTSDWKSE